MDSVRKLLDTPLYDEVARLWNETVLAYLKILFQHLPGGAKEDYEQIAAKVADFWTYMLTIGAMIIG